MSVLTANCPSCAAPIEFKAGSTVVVVCGFCRSVVARTDRAVEDLGKVAEIVETQSPLKVGLKGKYLEHGFELTGRAQLKHQAGGVWDEWYATFTNGWVGWLAEAQGKFYMTFYQPTNQPIPDYASLAVGFPLPVNINSTSFVVAEKGTATVIAAEGEIPYQLIPNETSYYADLSGAKRAFGTIDYGMNPPFVFVGKEVALAEIGLGGARPAERAARTVSAAGLGCPNCGGPLELRAPDKTERVTCPNCDSLIEVDKGNFRYLQTLKPANEPYVLEIGAVANFAGKPPMTLIGAVSRSVIIDAVKYFWQEYLLYNPSVGFRWLVLSDGHWNFVEPVAVGDVVINGAGNAKGSTATYTGEGAAKDKTFKIFQHATGAVEHVKGEFYWRVSVGETALMTDFVSAPLMLSREESSSGDSVEVNWSLGEYLPKSAVEKAFAIENASLPRASNVAPNQPFAYKGLWLYGVGLVALLFVTAIVLTPVTGLGSKAKEQQFVLPPMANAQAAQIVFSEPFELKGNRNVVIAANAPVNNSFVSIDVDLINEANSTIENVPLDVEFYSGVEEGEAWSEGSTKNDATLNAVPAGRYTLRIEGTWGNWQQPQPVNVTVEQGAFRGVNFVCAFILLAIMPIFMLIWQLTFETSRWSESMFSGSSGGSDDSSSSDD